MQGKQPDPEPRPAKRRRRWLAPLTFIVLSVIVIAGVLVAAFLVDEARTSYWQAHLLADLGRELSYKPEPGPSPAIAFPRTGPYDHRLGYADLPEYLRRLKARGYVIAEQARMSPKLARLADAGLFAPYLEKAQAGLTIFGCGNEPLFRARYPERIYGKFEDVPPVLVQTLLFIENRELLDAEHPQKNPAVEWDRFGKALLDQVIHAVDDEHETPGGSTLATQIEKYRHSPDGRTGSGKEKLRQMASASVRAYLKGPDTMPVRQQLVVDYLNSVPLSAKSGHGEVSGLGDGLWAWYDRDFAEVNRILAHSPEQPSADAALAYKQALSLMISQRRPSYYLGGNDEELEQHTNSYLRLLAAAGVITPAMRDTALAQRLRTREIGIPAQSGPFAQRKTATTVRTHLAGMLRTPRLYDLDRLDLTAASTLDTELQRAVTNLLRELRDPEVAKRSGLVEKRLLERGDPAKVIYSFTLFERTPHANVVRVQADNFDQPFDINEGTKLDLGSTAKLRVLVSYLEIVANLHREYGELVPEALRAITLAPQDTISHWAVEYLAGARDRSLPAMLDAALERKYSASPGEQFFTGGGIHTFENFDPEDNGRILSVREGLRRSVNLVFVRLMRDVVRHTMFNMPGSSATLLEDASDPRREEFLVKFADREGKGFIQRFYRKYQGKTPEETKTALLQTFRATPRRLAAVHRLIEPEADQARLRQFLEDTLPGTKVDQETTAALYKEYAFERFGLADRGHVAGMHPLELWTAAYLIRRPGASLSQTIEASTRERQEVYTWLLKSRNKRAQDSRIRTLVELEAFLEIHRTWKRLGYPFEYLVPSYASALGSSADRPAALAELMGILVNDGVRLPTVRISDLHFAADTPYDTRLAVAPAAGERVLPPEVARAARGVLREVVESGTAQRLKTAFKRADGTPLEVGGKTGTGDHRYEIYGKGGQLISSRVVSRSGTFVFFIGERYFGTLTAHVRGEGAADFGFTSALPAQILKVLAPTLIKVVDPGKEAGAACRPRVAAVAPASDAQ